MAIPPAQSPDTEDKIQSPADEELKSNVEVCDPPEGAADVDDACEDSQDDPATDTPPTARAESPASPTHSPYSLPVYIYNCPLNDLSEQLVNKWTYQRPFDVYEDLQFKPDEPRPDTPRGEVRGHSISEGPSQSKNKYIYLTRSQNIHIYLTQSKNKHIYLTQSKNIHIYLTQS